MTAMEISIDVSFTRLRLVRSREVHRNG